MAVQEGRELCGVEIRFGSEKGGRGMVLMAHGIGGLEMKEAVAWDGGKE